MWLELLPTGTTSSAPPTAATDGLALSLGDNPGKREEGFDLTTLSADTDISLTVESTAGSGVMTADLRLWLRFPKSGTWAPFEHTPTGGTDTNRGKLNSAVLIGEFATEADKLRFHQRIPATVLKNADRVKLEIVALGGTTPAIKAMLEARV